MGIKVLSCFDGISCGMVALERAGIKVDEYYASEIDKNAIKISKHNYPNIKHIGDITKVKGENLPKIDLLIGGSPCQGFSFAGKQLNFNDERSKLFFEYVRLLEETKPKYFLLENVKMKKEYQDVISKYLGVEPIEINSALVSAQNRKRLYWTNIPNIQQPKDRGILLKDIVDLNEKNREEVTDKIYKYVESRNYKGRKIETTVRQSITTLEQKSKTICTQSYSLGTNNSICIKMADKYFKPTQIEFERLQTLPDNYTSAINIRKAVHAIGNGWTVDVIAHIFKSLKN